MDTARWAIHHRCVIEDARVQLLRRYWDEAWSQGSVHVLSDVYAPHYRENDEDLTPEQFSGHLLRWREKFPDFRAEIERYWLSDDAVTTRVMYTGTHLGDFPFLPATGRRVHTSGLDVFEFNDEGRVVQHWHETDHWELFEQLGLGVSGS